MKSAGHCARATFFIVLIVPYLCGCAMVRLQSLNTDAYVDAKRGDILTTGKLGAASAESLNVLGLAPDDCRQHPVGCLDMVLRSDGLDDERRLATAAELSVYAALRVSGGPGGADSDAAVAAWLDTARYAYAYIFYTEKAPGQRAFEERQTQVRDYYNYAVDQAVSGLFKRYRQSRTWSDPAEVPAPPGWTISLDTHSVERENSVAPEAILAASTMRFDGLRSVYRRDGFGSEMVAVMHSPTLPSADATQNAQGPDFSEMPVSNLSVILRFEGNSLTDILRTRNVCLEVYDPYLARVTRVGTDEVPLAGNFSAAYGVWLARAGFSTQSLRTLFGWGHELDRPHIYLLQPYDPKRRVIVLMHGLASSPEAWVNMANELMGDERIRAQFQVWLAYYPTNAPLAYNHIALRRAISATLDHYDAARTSPSAHGMVLVGHSMGGVIARLMVSSSGGDALWERLFRGQALAADARVLAHRQLDPLLHFEPMPEVTDAVFIAAPHRGTPYARSFAANLVHGLVTVPAALTRQFKDVTPIISDTAGRVPTSMDNLRESDPFIRASAELAISTKVSYHTIVGRQALHGSLEDASDGVVPYRSAHLDGAASERVIVSGHSVQETAAAILEVRRILRASSDDSGYRQPIGF